MRMSHPWSFELHTPRRTFLLLACWFLLGTSALHAQSNSNLSFKGTPHEEVQKSMAKRDWPTALLQIEEHLETQPRDPQMRFWRARLLEQQQRTDEAFDIYVQLSEDYPELPEVQNNLGVLLAARGKTDEAKHAFEHALRNNPNYATAHENLGDILLHQAQRAYDKALMLNPGSRSIPSKLKTLQPALQLTLTKP